MFRVVSASWMRDKNHAEKLPKVIHKCVQERERERLFHVVMAFNIVILTLDTIILICENKMKSVFLTDD